MTTTTTAPIEPLHGDPRHLTLYQSTLRIQLRRAVERGAAMLDRHHPGWHDKIDLHKLDVWCPFNCVLGQLFGSYSLGCKDLEDYDSNDWSNRHGFNCTLSSSRFVKECWTDEINERRES